MIFKINNYTSLVVIGILLLVIIQGLLFIHEDEEDEYTFFDYFFGIFRGENILEGIRIKKPKIKIPKIKIKIPNIKKPKQKPKKNTLPPIYTEAKFDINLKNKVDVKGIPIRKTQLYYVSNPTKYENTCGTFRPFNPGETQTRFLGNRINNYLNKCKSNITEAVFDIKEDYIVDKKGITLGNKRLYYVSNPMKYIKPCGKFRPFEKDESMKYFRGDSIQKYLNECKTKKTTPDPASKNLSQNLIYNLL